MEDLDNIAQYGTLVNILPKKAVFLFPTLEEFPELKEAANNFAELINNKIKDEINSIKKELSQ